jgi:hypothetical protein
LDAGPVNLECKAHGYRQQLRRIALLPGESEHHEDFVLEPDWFVDVQLVTPSGRTLNRESAKEFLPEGSFHFAVSVAPPPERWTPGSSEERRGRRLVGEGFETPLMEGSFLRLTILGDPPLHLSVDVRGTVLASTRLDTRVEQASLVLPVDRFASLRGSFTCVVLDSETNTPFPRAHASLSGVGIYTPERFDADPTGRIQRGNLIPGRYALSLRAQGPVEGTWSARTIRTFDVQESSETDLGTITLDPSQHVQGRFVDARGQPVAGKGTVRPLSLDDAVAWMPEELGMQLGERPSGGFARDGLGKERYVLVASGRPWGNPKGDLLVASVVVDLREGSIDDLVVTLEVAHPVCIRAETDEAKDFVYRLADAAGVPFVHGVLTQPRTHWLAPGNYRALVGPDAGHLREIPFTHGTEALTIKVEP